MVVALLTLVFALVCCDSYATNSFIKPFVGVGTPYGFAGDNGPASSARLSRPSGLWSDTLNNIYIADVLNHRIRKVSGIYPYNITTVAGAGSAQHLLGDGGPATSAFLFSPMGVCGSSMGDIYIADMNNHRIRHMTNSGIISTAVGSNTIGYDQGATGNYVPALQASISTVRDMVVDTAGNIYFSETNYNKLRTINSSQIIRTFAGGLYGYNGENITATSVLMTNPTGLATDSSSNIYYCDSNNYIIRKVSVNTGLVNSIIGQPQISGYMDGVNSQIESCGSIWVDSEANVYFAEESAFRLRKLVFASNTVFLIAGIGGDSLPPLDGAFASTTTIGYLSSIIGDSIGNLYLADSTNNYIYKVSKTGYIFIVAGVGTAGFVDNVEATSAWFSQPSALSWDLNGNLLFADNGNFRIRQLSFNGQNFSIVSTVLGNGLFYLSDDGSISSTTSIGAIGSVRFDSYNSRAIFLETGNFRIRSADANIVTTILGTSKMGVSGYSGDQGSATAALLHSPWSVVTDSAGSLYIADSANNVIRMVQNGIISTIAGSGDPSILGDYGPATSAYLYSPMVVGISANGSILYIVDTYNYRIRIVVMSTGIISTVVGSGLRMLAGDGGPASSASISQVFGLYVSDDGSYIFSDTGNGRVRKVDTLGIISTIAGQSTRGYAGYNGERIAATTAFLSYPQGLFLDTISNDLWIADTNNYRLRTVSLISNNIDTAVGTGANGHSDINVANLTSISTVYSLTMDRSGNLVWAEPDYYQIRMLNISTGLVEVIAGAGYGGFNGDNKPGTTTNLCSPAAVWFDGIGDLYFSDNCFYRIRKMNSSNIVTTIVGNGVSGVSQDGLLGTSSSISSVAAIWGDSDGVLYFSDQGSHKIRMLLLNQTLSTFAGNGGTTYSYAQENVSSLLCSFNPPDGFWFDSSGNCYIAESTNNRIRKIAAHTKLTTTVIGSSSYFLFNDGPISMSSIYGPVAVVGDSVGNLYFTDRYNSRIRKIDLHSQMVSTIAGAGLIGVLGVATEFTFATQTYLNNPRGLTVDSNGNIFVSDFLNNKVRTIFNAADPTGHPTRQPSAQPSSVPTNQPTSQPTSHPTFYPTGQPSLIPSAQPTFQPSNPTGFPSAQPTVSPSAFPSSQPISYPSTLPSNFPTNLPSFQPTNHPTEIPQSLPSTLPSTFPSAKPSNSPTLKPSSNPTGTPSSAPSCRPFSHPTAVPSDQPVSTPSQQPSTAPTNQPSSIPSFRPSGVPTIMPTSLPSVNPSTFPSHAPTSSPTMFPSSQPSKSPTDSPTVQPFSLPTALPTSQPVDRPSSQPTRCPTLKPSALPSSRPSSSPSLSPSSRPSSSPSSSPTSLPSSQPSSTPSSSPTSLPSSRPSSSPSSSPTSSPSSRPSSSPSSSPTSLPSSRPSSSPSSSPTSLPSSRPSSSPSSSPTSLPSSRPSSSPSSSPTSLPSSRPSSSPSAIPLSSPSSLPSLTPSSMPSLFPSSIPSNKPTTQPTFEPISEPTLNPTSIPTLKRNLPPPKLLNTSITVGESAITIKLTLSSDGGAFVACFPLNSQLPTSIDAIILTGTWVKSSYFLATVSLQQLVPATEYAVFVVTQSKTGDVLPFGDVLAAKTVVRTLCCKKILASFESLVVEGMDVPTFLTLTLIPSGRIDFSLILRCTSLTDGSDCSRHMVPNIVQVWAASSTNEILFDISLTSLPISNYSLTVILPTIVTDEYSIEYNGQQTFSVMSSSFPVPPPIFDSALFSQDGTQVQIKFDKPTNLGGLTTSFICSQLLNFSCAASSQCRWDDPSNIVVSKGNCLVPGSLLRIVSAALVRARCTTTSASKCGENWPAMDVTQFVSVLSPASAISPTIILTLPSKVSLCSQFVLDTTMSSGHGGRSWLSSNISIEVMDQFGTRRNLSVLSSFIKSNYHPSFPLIIDGSFLLPDLSLTFTVTLCNFLGKCSRSVQSTWISPASQNFLTTVILGDSTRTMTAANTLSLMSLSKLSVCNNQSTVVGPIRYDWTIQRSGSQLFSILSTSRDPTKFILPPYSLEKNTIYSVQLLTSFGSVSALTSVNVAVGIGNLVLVVLGGTSTRIVREMDGLNIDASKSYDSDVVGKTGLGAGLFFSWTCIQVLPSLNSSCAAGFLNHNLLTASQDEKVLLQTTEDSAGSMFRLTVVVEDADRSRTSSATLDIEIVPLLAATISLSSNVVPSIGKINQDVQLHLTGAVLVPEGMSGNVSWFATDGTQLNLTAFALTPLIQHFPFSLYQRKLVLSLLLSNEALTQVSICTFGLKVALLVPGISSSSIITIVVNTAPDPGEFVVVPQSGIELSDMFTFACSNWQDSDLPLFYQFGYISQSNLLLTVRSKLELSSTSLLLPAGLEKQNYSLVVVAHIFDSLSASVQSTSQTIVHPLRKTFSTNELSNMLNNQLSTAENSDSLKQSVAIASYLLNKANCSHSPNCTMLNRHACYAVDNTCGSCISSAFIGVVGDSNDACMTQSELDLQTNLSQTCNQNCSRNGVCKLVSTTTQTEVLSCGLMSTTCLAVCRCFFGYFGKSCSYTSDDWQARVTMRNNVVSSVLSLAELDLSAENLNVLINSIGDNMIRDDEISASSAHNILYFANLTGDAFAGNSKPLSKSAMSSLLSHVNTVSVVLQSATLSSNYSRRLSNSSSIDDVGPVILPVLQSLSRAMRSSMIPGQASFSLTQTNFQLSIGALAKAISNDNESDCSTSTGTITLPKSLEYQLSNSATIPLCRSNVSDTGISLVSISSHLYPSTNMNSNVMALQLSNFPCDNVNGCNIQLTIPQQSVISPNESIGYSIVVACTHFWPELQTVVCPNGDSQVIFCDGSVRTVKVECPTEKIVPTCSSLNGLTMLNETCETLSYDDRTVTCSCSILSTLLPNARQLSVGSNVTLMVPAGEVSVQYLTLLTSVKSSFVSTVLTADNLNATTIQRGWESLVVVGSLAAAFILLVYVGYEMDEVSRKTTENMQKRTKGELKGMKGLFLNKTLELQKRIPIHLEIASKARPRINPLLSHHSKPVSGFLQFAENSLPSVLNSRSMFSKYKAELKRHHRWAGLFTHYTAKFPRVLRVMAMATNIITMLFVQSLVYNIRHGDNGLCEQYATESTCLLPTSSFSAGSSQCYWTPSPVTSTVPGVCRFVQPDNDLFVIVFIAIFSAVLSTPIAFLSDWILQNILAAPTKVLPQSTGWGINWRQTFSVNAIVPDQQEHNRVALANQSAVAIKRNEWMMKKAEMDFENLCVDLKSYRQTLTDHKEFDGKFMNVFRNLTLSVVVLIDNHV
jgi:sugar lactone lactonase YvrE